MAERGTVQDWSLREKGQQPQEERKQLEPK